MLYPYWVGPNKANNEPGPWAYTGRICRLNLKWFFSAIGAYVVPTPRGAEGGGMGLNFELRGAEIEL